MMIDDHSYAWGRPTNIYHSMLQLMLKHRIGGGTLFSGSKPMPYSTDPCEVMKPCQWNCMCHGQASSCAVDWRWSSHQHEWNSFLSSSSSSSSTLSSLDTYVYRYRGICISTYIYISIHIYITYIYISYIYTTLY